FGRLRCVPALTSAELREVSAGTHRSRPNARVRPWFPVAARTDQGCGTNFSLQEKSHLMLGALRRRQDFDPTPRLRRTDDPFPVTDQRSAIVVRPRDLKNFVTFAWDVVTVTSLSPLATSETRPASDVLARRV